MRVFRLQTIYFCRLARQDRWVFCCCWSNCTSTSTTTKN